MLLSLETMRARLTQLLAGFSGDTTWEYEPIGVPKKDYVPPVV